jgi:UDP-N-acetyl-D-mannosaminuronic acid transferase (WecB/TagA/CpsF family)
MEKKTFSSRKKRRFRIKIHQYFGERFDSIACKHAISPNFIHRCDAELLFRLFLQHQKVLFWYQVMTLFFSLFKRNRDKKKHILKYEKFFKIKF